MASMDRGVSSRKEAFFVWLSSHVPTTQLSELYITTDELDKYCASRKMVSSSLFAIKDKNSIVQIRVRLEGDRLFKFFNRGKAVRMIAILRHYALYLQEDEKTQIPVTNEEKPATQRVLSAISPSNENIHIPIANSIPTPPKKDEQGAAVEVVEEKDEKKEPDLFREFLLAEGKSADTTDKLIKSLSLVDELIVANPDMDEPIRKCKTYNQAVFMLSSLLVDSKFKQLNTTNKNIPLYAVQAYIRMLRNKESVEKKVGISTTPAASKIIVGSVPNKEEMNTEVAHNPASTSEAAKSKPVVDQTHTPEDLVVPDCVDPVVEYLKEHQIPFSDKRSQGGCLWLLGDMKLYKQVLELRKIGYDFRYVPTGGKTSGENPAWYLGSAAQKENSNQDKNGSTIDKASIKGAQDESQMHNAPIKMAASERRQQFEAWVKVSPSYMELAESILNEVASVDDYLRKTHYVDESIFELSSDVEITNIYVELMNDLRLANADKDISKMITRVLRCYGSFLLERAQTKDVCGEVKLTTQASKPTSNNQESKLTKDLAQLLAGDDLAVLRDELVKHGILTVDQLKRENLWVFMNRCNLYSIGQRQNIHRQVIAKLKEPASDAQANSYVLVTATAQKYQGSTPSEAFLEFCEFIAQKYPLKIRSLLDARYNGQGSVVLSRTDNGNTLKLMNPVAYISDSLTSQAAVVYGRWICKVCGEAAMPISMDEPREKPPKPVSASTKIQVAQQTPPKQTTLVPPKAAPVKTVAPSPVPVAPAPPKTAVPSKMLAKAEELVLNADLNGVTRESLCAALDTTMTATKDIIAASEHIVSLDNMLYHEDAFVDWQEGADEIERILDKLLDKNNGYATSSQLYEYVKAGMQMFLNDNDITTERMVYDLARHLFEKTHYHGRSLSFSMNKHISRGEAVSGTLDLVRSFARERGGHFAEADLVEYLQNAGIKTNNIRLLMRVYEAPIFFFYDDHVFLAAESMGIDAGWFDVVRKALDKLFEDMGDHVVLRDIQPWWYSQLPMLPDGLEWTPLLLQSVLMHYSKKLDGVHTISGSVNQTRDTLHAMIVTANSDIQTFADAVIAMLVDDAIAQRCFEAEELRQALIRRGMIAGNELIGKMPKILANDERFAWDAGEKNVRIKV